MDLYKLLGLNSDASEEDIKRGYRTESKVHHPDKGGDTELFKQIAKAYSILSDPEKRKRYDSGESAESISKAGVSVELLILRQLVELFTNIVLSTDQPQYSDIVAQMKHHLKNNLNKIDHGMKTELTKIERLEIVLNRIKKSSGENIFIGSAQAQITNIKLLIANMEASKSHNEKALKMLEDYSYQVDENPNLAHYQQFVWTTGV